MLKLPPSAARTGRRRRRDPLGRRYDRPAATHAHLAEIGPIPSTAELGQRSPCVGNGRRIWAVDTTNATSFQSAIDAVVMRTTADVVLVQEHKLLHAPSHAIARGWKSHLPLAWRTAANRASAGVGILSSGGIGLQPHDDAIPHEYSPCIAAAWIGGVIRGGIHCVSVYLRDSEGLSEANLAILTQLAALLKSLSGPWLVGGDWNLQPELLRDARWLDLVHGTVHAPSQPTCHSSTYDYFVVSATLNPAVVGVQRIADAGLCPHSPVRLLLRGDARRPMVRKLVRPPRINGVLPFGPTNDPDRCSSLRHAAPDGADLNIACVEWYAAARYEVGTLSGVIQNHHAATFKWSPAAGATAKRTLGASPLSVTWRVLAQRADAAATSLRIEQSETARTHINKLTATARHVAKIASPDDRMAIVRAANTCSRVAAAGSASMLKSIALALRKKAETLEVKLKFMRLKAWREWLGWKLRSSASRFAPSRDAFRWIRAPTGWAPSKAGPEALNDAIPDEDGECDIDFANWKPSAVVLQSVPICDQAQVEREAAEWAGQWAANAPYLHPVFPPELLQALPPASPAQIREAACTFPVSTGIGADNFAPRAVCRLTDRLLLALAAIFTAAENLGRWPDLVALVLIVLLPKSDGGFRPIGLFPTLIRIWFRLRLPIMRAWETRNAMPQMFGGQGMGAQRAAWVAAFNAEAAATARLDHACNLLDLVKAFERIPHAILARVAATHGYPLTFLRLCLQAYRLARSVGIAGLYSKLIVATRGITAGSGSATTELRILLLSLIRVVSRQWPEVMLTLYVDDLSIAMSGLALKVALTVGEVTSFVIRYFEADLGLEVSTKKSVAIASRPRLAQVLAARTKVFRGSGTPTRHSGHAAPSRCAFKAVRASKLLGAPFGGGRRRSARTLHTRLKDLQCRLPRIRAFRITGGDAFAYARTAALPAATYGIDIQGVADTQLVQLRRALAKAVSPPTAGRNPDLVHFAAAAAGDDVDPAHLAHVLPLYRWALAWWENWVPQSSLRSAFGARSGASATATAWNSVAGPTAAAVCTAARLGWCFLNAFTLQDDIGLCWHVLQDSPAAIAQAVRRSVQRWRFNSIVQQMPAIAPPEHTHDTHILLDVSDAIRPLFGRHAFSKTVPCWLSHDKPWLTSAMTGGQWPQARKAAVRAWAVDPNCQLCRAEAGTLDHRHVCPVTLPDEGWGEPPGITRRFLDSLGTDRARLLRTRALLAISVPRLPVNECPCITWVTDEPDVTRNDLQWYTDGSVLNAREGLPSAGCALVALDNCGALVAVARVALPSKVVTAPHAELYALIVLCQMLPSPPRVTTDCKVLLTTVSGGVARATAANKALAAEWNRLASYLDGTLLPLGQGLLVWAPAHCSLSVALTIQRSDGQLCTEWDWRANRLADAAAKAAAGDRAANKSVLDTVRAARAALAHSAAVLGAVTYAANHYRQSSVAPDGSATTIVRRDTFVPARPRPKPRVPAPKVVCCTPDAMLPTLSDCELPVAYRRLGLTTPSTHVTNAASARYARRRLAEQRHKASAALRNDECIARLVNQIGAAATTVAGTDAGARLSALRERIRRKELRAQGADSSSRPS